VLSEKGSVSAFAETPTLVSLAMNQHLYERRFSKFRDPLSAILAPFELSSQYWAR